MTTTRTTATIATAEHAGRTLEVRRTLDELNQGYEVRIVAGGRGRLSSKWARVGDRPELDSPAEAKLVAKLLKSSAALLDADDVDERLIPELERLATTDAGPLEANTVDPEVGDVVKLYSRGTTRYGVVVGVTGTGTVTAAYVTPGGMAEAARYGRTAQVTRKAAKAGTFEVVRWSMPGQPDADVARRAELIAG